MVEITLFEVHLDDSSFTANAPLSKSGGDRGERQEQEGPDTGVEASGDLDIGPPAKFLLAVVGLVILVAVARRLVGSDRVPDEELADVVA